MSKYLVMCEGPNEKAVVNILLENDLLFFNRNELLELDIYHARQLVPYLISAINTYNSPDLKIIRIGDKFKDKLKIPPNLKHLISSKQIIICRTHPELEMLLIVHNNLLKDYLKVKSKMKPKDFAKKYITLNNKKYDNSTQFWYDYYSKNPESLIKDIKECHKIGKNNKNELYLADLLK